MERNKQLKALPLRTNGLPLTCIFNDKQRNLSVPPHVIAIKHLHRSHSVSTTRDNDVKYLFHMLVLRDSLNLVYRVFHETN